MSLRQRVTDRFHRLHRSAEPEDCAICNDPFRESDTVPLEEGEAHRSCVRFAQAIGREVNRRDKVVRDDV